MSFSNACIFAALMVALTAIWQEYSATEKRNAYQQGVIDSQSGQLEYFKGKDK